MPRVTKLKATDARPRGWLVKAGQGYYTGNLRSTLECWTAFPQLAKVYRRQRWAQTMAARLGGKLSLRPQRCRQKPITRERFP